MCLKVSSTNSPSFNLCLYYSIVLYKRHCYNEQYGFWWADDCYDKKVKKVLVSCDKLFDLKTPEPDELGELLSELLESQKTLRVTNYQFVTRDFGYQWPTVGS